MLQQPWLPSSLPRCRLESRLLGNVRYFNDLIVTHSDQDYMARWAGGVGWVRVGGCEAAELAGSVQDTSCACSLPA